MLSTVKLALRISGNDFDTEIQLVIDSALKELEGLGILGTEETLIDPQIQLAVIAYAKWQFGFNDDGERWHQIYSDHLEKLKTMTGYTEWTEAQA